MKTSISWSNNEHPIEMPTRFLGKIKFDPKVLSKHCMIVGETGSGKSVSAVIPAMNGLFNYLSKDGLRYFMFVVDPKRELINHLKAWDELEDNGRVVDLSNDATLKKLNPFEGLSQYPQLSDKLEYLFNFFGSGSETKNDNAVFRDGGLSHLRELADLEEAFFKQTNMSLLSLLPQMWTGSNLKDPNLADGLYLFAKKAVSAAKIEHSKVLWSAAGINPAIVNEGRYSIFDLLEKIITHRTPNLLEMFGAYQAYQNDCNLPVNRSKDNLRQLNYLVSYWDLMLNTLRSERYKKVFDLNAALNYDGTEPGQIAKWVDSEKVLVITPIMGSSVDEMVVLNLKRLVFNSMLTRKNMLAPMAYVADEFQNFISTDEDSGEQNFLDRCRSYRVSCVLATQSLDSLGERVQRQNGLAGQKALSSMLNNISNRIIFRTSDILSSSLMRHWIEASPVSSGRHVLDNFPFIKLEAGECYWISGGEWSREQVELADLDEGMRHDAGRLEGMSA